MKNLQQLKAGNLVGQPSTPLHEQLTPRQLEVLVLLCEGLPNKLIGRRLNIAPGTVKIHVMQILRALNVSSRLQAVVAVRGLGLDLNPAHQEPIPRVIATTARPVGELCLTSGEWADTPGRRALGNGRSLAAV